MNPEPPALEERVVCLVEALNGLPGITTLASCDGHGMRYPYVDFVVDDPRAGSASLSVLSRAARACGWIIVVRAPEPRGPSPACFTLLPIDCVAEPEWAGAEVAVMAGAIARSVRARDALPRLAERVLAVWEAESRGGCYHGVERTCPGGRG